MQAYDNLSFSYQMAILLRYRKIKLTVADLFTGKANLIQADFNHCYLGAIIHRCAVADSTLTTELTKKDTALEQYF